MTTALAVARKMNLSADARIALDPVVHPQERTQAFHEVFGAPIHIPQGEGFDPKFSHMDDQRVAFRTSFILSEAIEILEKGLGIDVSIAFSNKKANTFGYPVMGSDNKALADAILEAMQNGGCERDLVEVVDGLGDLNVVVNGFAVELGVDMPAVDQEILASNFTKLGSDGQPIIADGSDPKYPAGKILKGPNFVEPNIAAVLSN